MWFSITQSSDPERWYKVPIVTCGWSRGILGARIVTQSVSSPVGLIRTSVQLESSLEHVTSWID